MWAYETQIYQRLQTTNSELTLDKAITMAQRTVVVREQQVVVRGKTDNTYTRIEAV